MLGPSSHSRWSYAASKLLDEFLGLAAYREYELPVTIVRFFNTVGPGQTGRYGMVVPRFVRQALHGEPITVYGDGEQSRCFCHVYDTVRALEALLDDAGTAPSGEIYNVGSNQEVTINQLAEAVLGRTDSPSEIRHIPYNEAYAPGFEDMRRRVPDTGKLSRGHSVAAPPRPDRISWMTSSNSKRPAPRRDRGASSGSHNTVADEHMSARTFARRQPMPSALARPSRAGTPSAKPVPPPHQTQPNPPCVRRIRVLHNTAPAPR